jgi:hypothetical protein
VLTEYGHDFERHPKKRALNKLGKMGEDAKYMEEMMEQVKIKQEEAREAGIDLR